MGRPDVWTVMPWTVSPERDRGVSAFLASLAIAVVLLLPARTLAQSYPSRPVHYVVGFPPGDAPDLVARLVGERLAAIWGQQVMVENRLGASGTIAAAFVAKASPDGYTLLLCNIASNAIAPAIYAKL